MRLVRLVVVLMLGWLPGGFGHAADDTVTNPQTVIFNITTNGYPPFLIPAVEGRETSGIMYDVLCDIMRRRNIAVSTIGAPKNRELRYIEQGKLDVYVTAREWVSNPEDYVFTDPVLYARDVALSKKSSPLRFNSAEDLIGKKLIAHLGFVYPHLSPYFDSGRIERIDAINGMSMLKMVLSGRADAAIMNDVVGNWMIRRLGIEDQLELSDTAFSEIGYRFLFTKGKAGLAEFMNRQLEQMRKSGALNAIFQRYGYNPPGSA